MKELFWAVTVEEAREKISKHIKHYPGTEEVPLLSALGRCLARDVVAAEDVPGFDRSTVDGYAVRARDTFGASEGLPAYLEVSGEVQMGCSPDGAVGPGRAYKIATGGMLPFGADAVVMVEHTEELGAGTIGVTRPVAPGENVIRRGEDIAAGSVVLPAGHVLRPQDLGVMAAVGVTAVEVRLPWRVGIISTGDELVAPEEVPAPGQVRDINSYSLYGAVKACGGAPHLYGIVRDDLAEMRARLARALGEMDMVLLSGGSSVGTRDVALEAVAGLGKPGILFHGLSLKPGKPTIGAVVNGKPVFGLPGHPASALVVFELLVAPLICRGCYPADNFEEFPLRARITRNLPSAPGREDFVRVKLKVEGGTLWAEPVLGKSGLISTMVKADGLARVPAAKEGVEAGEWLEVKIY